MSTWVVLTSFVGGIGLFLLGMHLMTEGAKVAAGRTLRDRLARGTRTRGHALLSGALLTGLVQSSSAVTVATIGFVNAGLLTLPRAIWVIYGCNVGTTTTGWIVAGTGFAVNLEVIALPCVAAGMLTRLFRASRRRAALGDAITGFGLFFLGLGFMQGAFANLSSAPDFAALGAGGPLGALLHLGIGAALTVATQSSSASLAVTLTAAAGGVIDLPSAGAMVVGANLGTTSTAVFATIGATPNARRTAAAHVAFNVVAALLALALLPWILELLSFSLRGALGEAHVGTTLAVFHTVFNLLGVVAIWPLTPRLVRTLEKRFRTRVEDDARPRHLDPNVLAVPSVAFEALLLETRRLGHLASNLLRAAVDPVPPEPADLDERRAGFEGLLEAVSDFMRRLDRSGMSVEVAEGLQALLRATQHYLIAVEQATIIARLRLEGIEEELGSKTLPGFLAAVAELARVGDPTGERFDVAALEQSFGALDERYEQSRGELVQDAAMGTREARSVLWRQLLMAEARRGAKHVVRAAERLRPHA